MKSLIERLPASFPEVALVLEPPVAVALRVARGRGGVQVVARAEEPLEWGGEEGLPPDRLRALADRFCTAVGAPQRLSVLLGDPLLKMQVLSLTDFPSGEEERLQVIRWHIRKVLNISLDDLRVRYQVLERSAGAATLWLTLGSETLAKRIEEAFAASGCHVGFLGAVTPELFNLASRHGMLPAEGSVLILSRTARSLSFLFAENGTPRFYRCKELREDDLGVEESHQIAQEIRLTLAYHRERVGGAPLATVLVRSASPGLTLPLEEELGDGVGVQTYGEALRSLAAGGYPQAALPLLSVLEA